jgi:futalosine hydrolase
MYILLAAATKLEIQPAIDFLDTDQSGSTRHETAILITGLGSVATTYSLMHHFRHRRPDLVIQAGIAGCFSPVAARGTGTAGNRGITPGESETIPRGSKIASWDSEISPGEVVAINEEVWGDLGVWEDQRFKTVFDLGFAGRNDPPFSNGLLINPYEKLLGLSALRLVRSVTVNEITTRPDRVDWYQQNLKPVVESMEGGALHYVCLQENIAFLQIRSVSNYIGERDKTKWVLKTAVNHLNERLIALIGQLTAYDRTILIPKDSIR